MRSRRLLGTSLALVFLLLTSLPAAAKGPGSATITGPAGTSAEGGPVTRIEPDPANGIRGGWHRPLGFGAIVSGTGLRSALDELGIEIPPPDPGTVIKRILMALTAGMIWKI